MKTHKLIFFIKYFWDKLQFSLQEIVPVSMFYYARFNIFFCSFFG